jgi:DNA-directed RNA polymerase subunit beta'
MVENGEKIKAGKVLLKFHVVLLNQEILGGLPRITELLEARNPSNPAVVSEIDGVVSEKSKEVTVIVIESKFGDVRKYLVKLSSQILVQENDCKSRGTFI